MQTIEFNQAKFIYNIDNKTIFKIKLTKILGVITLLISTLIITYFLSTHISPITNNIFYSIFTLFLTLSIFIFGGIYLLIWLLNQIAPKEYDLIMWLKRLKKDELNVGYINNKLTVTTYTPRNGWRSKELKYFLPNDLDFSLEENTKNNKTIYMTIDFTKAPVIIQIKNKK